MKIQYSVDICRGCGLPKLITHKSLHLCTTCNQKRLAKSYRARLKQRIMEGKITDKEKLARFFKKYWKKYPNHECFESGNPLWTYHSYHLHHLIEKSEHPELAFKEDNIVYLTLLQHHLWHSLDNKDRKIEMPILYKKTQEIKKKYNVGD